jgi:hypothetical protein
MLCVGCTTYRDALVRSQDAFQKNEYEQTLGMLRALEPDVSHLTTPEQAQYAYLRGMTDYRIGHRTDARHWLAIARAHDDATPGTLPVDWRTRLNDALSELDAVVQTQGYAALGAKR